MTTEVGATPGRGGNSPPPRSAAERGRWRRSRRRGRSARPADASPPVGAAHLRRRRGRRAISSCPATPPPPTSPPPACAPPAPSGRRAASVWQRLVERICGRARPSPPPWPGRGSRRRATSSSRRDATLKVLSPEVSARDGGLERPVSPHRSFGSPPAWGGGNQAEPTANPIVWDGRWEITAGERRPDRPPRARPRRPSCRRPSAQALAAIPARPPAQPCGASLGTVPTGRA
jgi:hypothetical protein